MNGNWHAYGMKQCLEWVGRLPCIEGDGETVTSAKFGPCQHSLLCLGRLLTHSNRGSIAYVLPTAFHNDGENMPGWMLISSLQMHSLPAMYSRPSVIVSGPADSNTQLQLQVYVLLRLLLVLVSSLPALTGVSGSSPVLSRLCTLL